MDMMPKRENTEAKTIVSYVPHGVDPNMFFRFPEERSEELKAFKTNLVGDAEFVVLFNNRNIRRKMPANVIQAFHQFAKKLPKEKQNKVCLLMHTQACDDNGTDLRAVIRDIAPDVKIVIDETRLNIMVMNLLCNTADVVINLACAEGFGIGTLEGMMAERMMIASVIGGLQDQMGFVDEKGEYLNENIHFTETWGTNKDGRYTTHGEWCVPIFPKAYACIGSPPTPYIDESHVDWTEAADAIRTIYDMTPEERLRRGKLAREYCLTGPFNTKEMCRRMMASIDYTLANWTPRKRFGMYTP